MLGIFDMLRNNSTYHLLRETILFLPSQGRTEEGSLSLSGAC